MRELESRLVFGMDRFETRPQRGIRQHRVIGDENRNRHPGAIHLAGGGEYPLVPAFRKDYPALEISRALADTIDEPHFGNFFANAFATAGCTRPLRLPWCLATSRTTLELMYVVSTLRPAAVEGDCRRAIFARHSSLRHGRLRLVFNAQHSAEGTRLPMLRQLRGVAGCIRWISKGDIVRKRLQRLGESERGLSMD